MDMKIKRDKKVEPHLQTSESSWVGVMYSREERRKEKVKLSVGAVCALPQRKNDVTQCASTS